MPLDFSKLHSIPVSDSSDPELEQIEAEAEATPHTWDYFPEPEPPAVPDLPAPPRSDSSTLADFTIINQADLEESRKLQQELLDGILGGRSPEALLLLAVRALGLLMADRTLTDQMQEELLWLYGPADQTPEQLLDELQKGSKQLRARIRALERITTTATKPMEAALRQMETLTSRLQGNGL